jgi:TolB-like protein/tetratricopeptide (TPR) repeat protein
MGVVYRARDHRLGRPVALKLLPPWLSGDAGAVGRFAAEARAASAIDHPNIGTLHAIEEADDGALCLVMALYEGATLKERLERGPLETAEAIEVTRQVARGLAAAHRRGIVHRDIKPANLLLTEDGLVKILDFGVAKVVGADVTARGAALGTTAYMSPEQVRGDTVDERSDLWSLGVVLYEMLAGQRPFRGASEESVARAILDREPSSPAVPGRLTPSWLVDLVQRLLAKDPERRPQSAAEVVEALDRGVVGLRAGWRGRTGRQAIVAAAVVLLVGIGVVVAMDRLSDPGDSAATGDRSAVAEPAVAVLELEDLSPDTSDAYLAVGLTEEIASRLGRAAGLRVKSPSAVRRALQAGPMDPGTIAERLGVQYLVEGSVGRSGDRIHIAARLVQSEDGFQVWSDAYDVEEAALPVVRDRIAEMVAGAVAGKGIPADLGASGRGLNPESYAHYLRGNYYLNRRTPQSILRAIEEYRAASRSDPDFIAPQVREAYAYGLFIDWGWPFPGRTRAQLLDAGLAMTSRALEKDPRSPEAWLTRAYLLVQVDPRNMSGATEAFERAISLDPDNAEAYHQYGQTLMVLGRFEEAMRAYERTLALEPDRAMTLVPMGGIRNRQGRDREALAYSDSAVRADPSVPYAFSGRALQRRLSGDCQGARADAETALQIDSSYPVPALSQLASALHCLGDRGRAAREMAQAMREIGDPAVPSPTEAYFLGAALIAMGREEEAIDLMERARPRGALLWFLFLGPDFEPVRENERFQTVMRDSRPAPRGSRAM